MPATSSTASLVDPSDARGRAEAATSDDEQLATDALGRRISASAGGPTSTMERPIKTSAQPSRVHARRTSRSMSCVSSVTPLSPSVDGDEGAPSGPCVPIVSGLQRLPGTGVPRLARSGVASDSETGHWSLPVAAPSRHPGRGLPRASTKGRT